MSSNTSYECGIKFYPYDCKYVSQDSTTFVEERLKEIEISEKLKREEKK